MSFQDQGDAMIKKVLCRLRRAIGSAEVVQPIVDPNIYRDNKMSYSGGSLNGSNVLVMIGLIPGAFDITALRERLEIEGCRYQILFCEDDILDKKCIEDASDKMIGPFEHIINLVRITEGQKDDEAVGSERVVATIYRWLQIESSYLIDHTGYGTLCSAIIWDDENRQDVVSVAGLRSLMSGLGKVMARHKIIENGLIAPAQIPIEDIAASITYLSGKYGQILAGEVLDLRS